MRGSKLFVVILGLVLSLWARNADAQTQITLGNSSQDVTFQATSGTDVNVAVGSCTSTTFTGTCTLSGTAFFSSVGTFTITTTTSGSTPMTASFVGSGLFDVSMNGATSTFDYHDGTNTLDGSITWTTVANGSTQPHLNGIITGLSVSGNSAFTSTFSGSAAFVTLITQNMSCTMSVSPCTLENLLLNTSAQGSALTGSSNVIPSPEPASMVLFGTGLLAIGGFVRRKRQA